METEKDWKLKLRYGKLTTSYKHYTLIADGIVGDLIDDYNCRPGSAMMSIKVWALDMDQALEMIKDIGLQVGFKVNGKVETYKTDPERPPKENPFGYDINFVPYDS